MTDWVKANLIPRDGLEGWHHFMPGHSLGHLISDYSGHDRHVVGEASNAPELQADRLNHQPAWYFDGTKDPLSFTGAVTVRHLFVLASFEKATFTQYEGLYGWVGDSGGPEVLVSNSSGDRVFDFSPSLPEMSYRRADIGFPIGNAKAPVNGQHALIELVIPGGASMDGIQIGQQGTLVDRRFNGWFFEAIAYSNIKGEFDRQMILEYFAMRYHVWPRSPFGHYRFPFIADRTRGLSVDRETYLSEPYEGEPKALIRGEFTDAYELPFALRRREEYRAAEAFHNQHSPLVPFVFRDERFIPGRERICRFSGPINEQGSGVSHKFNYSFAAGEIAGGTTPPTISISTEITGSVGGPFSVDGIAADDIGIAFSQLFVDGLPYGPPIFGNEPEFIVNAADFPVGIHWIYAETFDVEGNSAVSNTLSIDFTPVLLVDEDGDVLIDDDGFAIFV